MTRLDELVREREELAQQHRDISAQLVARRPIDALTPDEWREYREWERRAKLALAHTADALAEVKREIAEHHQQTAEREREARARLGLDDYWRALRGALDIVGAATRAVTAWESGEPAETVMATLRDAVMRESKR